MHRDKRAFDCHMHNVLLIDQLTKRTLDWSVIELAFDWSIN